MKIQVKYNDPYDQFEVRLYNMYGYMASYEVFIMQDTAFGYAKGLKKGLSMTLPNFIGVEIEDLVHTHQDGGIIDEDNT